MVLHKVCREGLIVGVIGSFIEECIRKNPESSIEEYKGDKYSYKEFLEEINRYINKIDVNTYQRRKCIVVCRHNIEELKALFFCWKVDMIAIPMSIHYGTEQCKKIIEVVSPDLVLTDDYEIQLDVEAPIYLLDTMPIKCKYKGMVENLAGIELMLCTSGTTGMPKASMFEGDAIRRNCVAISEYFPITFNDTILVARPLYHCAVMVGEVLTAFYNGCNLLFYSNAYNPIVLSRILCSNNITIMCGTPTIFKGISEALAFQKKQSQLKVIALSGEYLLPEYAKVISKAFNAMIFNVYGLTEAGPRISYLPANKFDEIPSSVGIPLKNVKISIVYQQEPFNAVADKEIGRIWVKTPCLMKGYYKNELLTKERMHGDWYDTGDVGYINDGYLYVVGRSDDMIIKGGLNIYPREIESRILNIDGVKAALVYSIIIDNVEQICADVILSVKDCMDILQLKKNIADKVEGYMMPYVVNIVEDFKRNASGKVVRPKKIYRV